MQSDQIRTQIQSLLQPANQPSQLQISHTTFSSPNIGTLLDTYYAGNDIFLNSATLLAPEDSATYVVVSGTSSFLNVANTPVDAIFQAAQDGIDLTLKYHLPQGWKFSQSFPTLPVSLDFRTPLGAPQNSYLDLLTLTDACFLVSTSVYQDPQFQAQAEAGCNFISHLALNGILGGAEELLSAPDKLILSGPLLFPTSTQQVVQPLLPSQLLLRDSAPRPGINLKAEIATTLSFEKLALKDLFLRIYSPLTTDWLDNNPTYGPGLFLGGDLQIGTQISLEIIAEKTLGSDSALMFIGVFDGLTLPSLSAIADFVGADDLATMLTPQPPSPAFFSDKGSLSIETASLAITTDPFSIASVSLTVGLENMTWQAMAGQISVSNLAARFEINNPFNAQRDFNAILFGQMMIDTVPLSIAARAPEFVIQAALSESVVLPLSTLMKTYLPQVPAVSNLTVDQMYLEAAPGSSFSLMATLADKPQPWVINLGVAPLAVSNVQLGLSYAQGAGASGMFGGTITLAGVSLTTAYQMPGAFMLRGQFPSLSLKTLLTQICNKSMAWPSGFDLDLDQSSILIEQQSNKLSLNVVTDIKDLGLLALTVQQQADQWGFALGMDLSLGHLASVPSLSALAPIETYLGLENLLLIFSSLDQQPNFPFPDLAAFQAPTLSQGRSQIVLPAQASGLVQGLNLYANLSTSQNKGFQALAKYLGLKLDGTIGLTLAVSLPDPVTNSRCFLSINETLQHNMTLVGECGVLVQGSNVEAFLTGVLKAQTQGQPLEFDVLAAVLADGALISGTMKGTLKFDAVQLSNLALVIGIDLEGLPSLGIAATLDISNFESSLALFFDSTNPSGSLVAGSISDVTLSDIVHDLAGQSSVPATLETVLGKIGLQSISGFSLPASVASSLDGRNIAAISAAFKQYGNTPLPTSNDSILLVVNKPGTLWHLTDLSTMKHYSLTLQGANVLVDLQPQFYCAPAATAIGTLQYPMGFSVIAHLRYLLIDAQINIQISKSQGILAEVDLAPIVLLNQTFFAITGSNGQGGPLCSLATYSRPQVTDPRLRDPHFLLSGKLVVLGADLSSTYILVDEHGLTIELAGQVNPALFVDLKGSIDTTPNLSLGGSVRVGIDRQLDLAKLGQIHVNTQVNGSLTVGYAKQIAAASIRGGFVFQQIQASIPTLTLDVSGPALRNIGDTLWNQISDILTKLLKDGKQWLIWVKRGVIQGAGQSAEAVGAVLSSSYGWTTSQIATGVKDVMGYGLTDVTRTLKGAGSTADAAVNQLKSMGYQVSDITAAIPQAFTHTHADTNVGHVDTPAGPHLDTAAKHIDVAATHVDSTSHADVPLTHVDSTSHADVPRSHVDSSSHADVPRSHIDSSVFGHHTDTTVTPHGDSNPHADTTTTPHGDSNPHADTTTTPHGDSNPHVDQTTTPHGDSTTPHADSQVPPHGDTSTHVDVKA